MKNRKFKRMLSIILCIMLIMSSTAYADAGKTETATYPDIVGNKYETQLREWIANGFIKGYPDGNFKPENQVTRSEFMALVNRLYGFTETVEINYSDIVKNAWYYKDAAIATKAGYIQGAYGKLMPLDNISRQEMAVILARLTKNDKAAVDNAVINRLADGKDIPAWSKAAVSTAMKNKFFEGFVDNTFNPTEKITRLEAVVALDRAFKSMYKSVYMIKGTYGPATGTETLEGDVVIIAPEVTLKNTIIKGNLILRETIGEGSVYLDNVVVKGDTIVKGGGANSIIIKNSTLGKVTVIKEGNTVRIVATGSTTIDTVNVGANAKLEEYELTGTGFNDVVVLDDIPEGANVIFEGDFGNVEIDSSNINVTIEKGTIGELTITENASNANLNLAEGAKVTTLTLDAAAKVTGKGSIGTANINANGAEIEQRPATVKLAEGVNATVGGQPAASTPAPVAGGGGGGGWFSPNAAPVARNVTITGNAIVGETLTGSYTYSDAENNAEGNSIYKWYRGPKADGSGKSLIPNATSKTYTVQEADKGMYLFFEVTPKAVSGTVTGAAVISPASNKVMALYEGSEAADYVVAENFNTHLGTNYRGINVGFKLINLNLSDLESIEVSLFKGDELLAVNAANEKLLTMEDSNKQHSTPFIVKNEGYVEEYWTLGGHSMNKTTKPTKAVIIITDKNSNVYKVENNNLVEPNGITYESLFEKVITGDEAREYVQTQDFGYRPGRTGYNVGFKLNLDKISYDEIQKIEVVLVDASGEELAKLTATGSQIMKLKESDIKNEDLDGQLSAAFIKRDEPSTNEYWDSTPYDLTIPAKAIVRITTDFNIYIVETGAPTGGPEIDATVRVIDSRTVEVTMEQLEGATFTWNGGAVLSSTYADGKYILTVPLMESGKNNSLVISKKGYNDYVNNSIIWTAPYNSTATLGEWVVDRSKPAYWNVSNGWITLTTDTAPANNWYAWQGKKAPTNVGLTSQWMVETQLELTQDMITRDGIRTSVWVAIEGSENFGSPNWKGVIDWACMQFKRESATDTAGWQTWDSTDPGQWEDVDNIPTETGIYTLTMVYESGTLYQYIDGVLVNSYDINTEEGISAPTYIIIQSYSFGQSYSATWKVPTVKYVNQYPADAKIISSVDQLKSAIAEQKDGETWIITAGTYELPRDTETLRDNNGQVVTSGGQAGWYFPITANDLTIIGIDNPVITSSDVTENGAWASQNLITVWGDNVTIKGLTIQPKVEENKSIEVVGDKKFTITGCTFTPNTVAKGADATYGGALYFNGMGEAGKQDILVENNKFNRALIAFDSVASSDGSDKKVITIKGNTFENISGYAIGNTYWGSADRKTMQWADVNIIGNNFNGVDNETKIIAARLNQTFILDGTNKIEGQLINKDDFEKYINFNNLTYWPECKNNKVIVDGVLYESPYKDIDAYVTDVDQLIAAINAAEDGDTILLAAGDYSTTDTINVNKAVIIKGAPNHSSIFNTDGSKPVFTLSAAATLDGIFINKTNKANQHLVTITANGASVVNCKFVGKYEQGDSEVTRAIVPNAGIAGYVISGNHFENLRQPAYLEGPGTVTNNLVKNTRGWVVCVNHAITFLGNTFEGNAVDIAIIANNQTQSDNYKDIVAISRDNNGAHVENQLIKATAKNGNIVVDAKGNEYINSFQNALKAAQNGDTIYVAEGEYFANQFIIPADKNNITIQGAGMDKTIFRLTAKFDGFRVEADNVVLKDFSINTIEGDNKAVYGLRAHGINNLNVENVKITNMARSAFDVNGSTNSTFTGIVAENNGGYGIAVNQSKNVTFSGSTANNGWGAVLVANKPQPFENTSTAGINILNVVSNEPLRLNVENYIPGVDITGGITFDRNSVITPPQVVPDAGYTKSLYFAKELGVISLTPATGEATVVQGGTLAPCEIVLSSTYNVSGLRTYISLKNAANEAVNFDTVFSSFELSTAVGSGAAEGPYNLNGPVSTILYGPSSGYSITVGVDQVTTMTGTISADAPAGVYTITTEIKNGDTVVARAVYTLTIVDAPDEKQFQQSDVEVENPNSNPEVDNADSEDAVEEPETTEPAVENEGGDIEE